MFCEVHKHRDFHPSFFFIGSGKWPSFQWYKSMLTLLELTTHNSGVGHLAEQWIWALVPYPVKLPGNIPTGTGGTESITVTIINGKRCISFCGSVELFKCWLSAAGQIPRQEQFLLNNCISNKEKFLLSKHFYNWYFICLWVSFYGHPEENSWAYILYGFCIEIVMFLEVRHFQSGW